MAKTNIVKKLELEDFVAKATQKYNNRKKVADLDVEGFGIMTFTRPTDSQFLEYKNVLANSVSMQDDKTFNNVDYKKMLDAAKELLYNTCKFLHNEELQKELECVEPWDISVKIFGIDYTIELAQEVNNSFDDDTDIKDTVKN